MYSTDNAFRLRWTPNGLAAGADRAERRAVGHQAGQRRQAWFQGGASGMPGYFQFPDALRQLRIARSVRAGPEHHVGRADSRRRHPGGPAGHAHAGWLADSRAPPSAGNEIYRGDRLPKDLVGDYLYGEVVARIVRRLRPVKTEGLTQLQNVVSALGVHSIARPALPPGGHRHRPRRHALHRRHVPRHHRRRASGPRRARICGRRSSSTSWTRSIGHGRICRLTYDGIERDRTQPRMLNETPAQLVAHLSHPNGWWRDTAQQLLVLKQDKSVAPALEATGPDPGQPARPASTRCGRSKDWARSTPRSPAR